MDDINPLLPKRGRHLHGGQNEHVQPLENTHIFGWCVAHGYGGDMCCPRVRGDMGKSRLLNA